MSIPIASAARVKELMARHGFSFKKSLGQNFLIDAHVLQKIVAAAGITEDSYVIEVGPGIGALTEALAQKARHVTAVEIDRSLIPVLADSLSEYRNVEIVEGDILKIDLTAMISERGYQTASVVANLPYYITTPIIMGLLEKKCPLDSITVMVQKEVAERMQAKPGSKDYGALSLAVQYRAVPYLAANVPQNCFMPRPNVDSAVIRLTPRAEPAVCVTDESLFFEIIKAAFSQRRKTLVNCLAHSGLAGGNKEEIAAVLMQCGIDEKSRGETLGLEEFAKITEALILRGM